MVRTKADSGARKAVAAKAPRKVLGGGSAVSSGSSSSLGSPSSSKSNKYAGGNSVCSRPTPEWQKGIVGFFQKENKENTELADSVNKEQELSSTQNSADSVREPETVASGSSSSRKKARISSDEEDDD